jgi:WS/DGAT/MGAT family acyltransferase
MSDVEAMMWNVEKDPYLSSTFGSLTIFDRPVDMDRLLRRLEYTVSCIPRLRQKVSPGLGRLAPPEWSADPEFDLGYHVRRIGMPSPGTERQLFELAPLLVQDPFDRTRPLWEFIAIDGLEGGRGALLQKMHHTITDGEGGIRMSEKFVDLERDADDPEPLDIPESEMVDANLIDTSLETLGHGLRRAYGVTQRATADAASTLVHPDQLAAIPTDMVETGRSLARQVMVNDRAHSPLWTTRSLRRYFDVLDVSFDDAKRAAKTLGGSLNDFFVTGASSAAGRYHREKGAPVDELRMAMPVSTRTDTSAGGNSFVPTRVLVPTGDETIVERFEQVRDRLGTTKGEKAIGMVGALSGFLNVLPTSMLVRFARQQVETIDFTTSNVRAAPFDLYIAGGLITGNYPLGPLGGTAFNLTMMSYRGALNMGLHVDRGAIDDPALLRELLVESFDALVAAGA